VSIGITEYFLIIFPEAKRKAVGLLELNPECVRSVLLYIEKNQTMSESGNLRELKDYEIAEALKSDFGRDDVFYSLSQSHKTGLIERRTRFSMSGPDSNAWRDNIFCVTDITPKGHEFIDAIRSDNIWNKTKEKMKNAGVFTLELLIKTAAEVAKTILLQNL
jgi:hypothetical protein